MAIYDVRMTERVMVRTRKRTGAAPPFRIAMGRLLVVASGFVAIPFYALVFGWMIGVPVERGALAVSAAAGAGLGFLLAAIMETARSSGDAAPAIKARTRTWLDQIIAESSKVKTK